MPLIDRNTHNKVRKEGESHSHNLHQAPQTGRQADGHSKSERPF